MHLQEQGMEGITVIVAGGMDEHSHVVFGAAEGGQPTLPRLKDILPFHGERVQEWHIGDEGCDAVGRLDRSRSAARAVSCETFNFVGVHCKVAQVPEHGRPVGGRGQQGRSSSSY
jgi:hypothetical protein